MTTAQAQITKQPTYASSGIALLAAVCVTGLTTSHPLQRTLVGVEAMGIFLVLVSGVIQQRGRRRSGLILLMTGGCLVSITLGLSAVFPVGLIERGAFVSGMLGPIVVMIGVYPLRERWTRQLTGLGIAVLLSTIVVRGWLAQINQIQLLLAVLLTILVWDAVEHAIRLGNDVGRGTGTVGVSLTHTAGSLLIGLLAVIIAVGIYGTTPSTIPLVALALLLAGALLLILSLYLGYLKTTV